MKLSSKTKRNGNDFDAEIRQEMKKILRGDAVITERPNHNETNPKLKTHNEAEAANFLELDLATMREIREAKELPYYAPKRKNLYFLADLMKFRESETYKKYEDRKAKPLADYTNKLWLNNAEVQDMLHIGYSALRELRDEKALPFYYSPNYGIMYKMEDVVNYIEKGFNAPPDMSRLTIHRRRQLRRAEIQAKKANVTTH